MFVYRSGAREARERGREGVACGYSGRESVFPRLGGEVAPPARVLGRLVRETDHVVVATLVGLYLW